MHFPVTAYDIICVLHCAYLGNILNWNNTEWKHFPVDVQLWCHSQSLSAGQINDFVHLHFSKRNYTGKEKKKCSWKVLKEVADTLIFILTCDFTRMNNWFLELHYKLWEWRVFKCRQLMLYSQKRRGRGVFFFFSEPNIWKDTKPFLPNVVSLNKSATMLSTNVFIPGCVFWVGGGPTSRQIVSRIFDISCGSLDQRVAADRWRCFSNSLWTFIGDFRGALTTQFTFSLFPAVLPLNHLGFTGVTSREQHTHTHTHRKKRLSVWYLLEPDFFKTHETSLRVPRC